jgi:hypothetical protein
MIYDFTLRQGDTLPIMTSTLTDSNGAAIKLDNCTVKFLMRRVNTSRIVGGNATVADAAAGKVSYPWSERDTAESGDYHGHWLVTTAAGEKLSVPNDGHLQIKIEQAF